MAYVNLDNQHILHCGNCGASFFELNSINRISIKSAEILAGDKKTDEISGKEKHCPKDKAVLKTVNEGIAVPHGITLLRCPTCMGVFVYPDDLVKFKQAQKAKIQFFKLWDKPLPSLAAVLVVSLVLIVSVAGTGGFQTFLNRFSYQSQASDLIKKVYISTSGQYLFISFKTDGLFKSEVVFQDRTQHRFIRKIISEQPNDLHMLTTADVEFRDDVYYQIVLTDREGKIVETEFNKLIQKSF